MDKTFEKRKGYAYHRGQQTCYTTSKGLQQLLNEHEKLYKSELKHYFDEKAAFDDYVVAKLAGRVYKLEELPGGSKNSHSVIGTV